MSRTAPELMPPPDPNLGVIEAMGQGWRLMREDFWSLWTITVVVMLIQGFSGPAAIVVGPPMLAGFYYVLARRMTGHLVEVKDVFEGFRQVFKESVIAGLLPMGVGFVAVMIWLPVHLVIIFGVVGAGSRHNGPPSPEMIAALAVDFGLLAVLILVSWTVHLLFIFAQCAVWNTRDSGWEAAKFSVRLVRDHLGSVVGMVLLFVLVILGAEIAGILTCLVGLVFFIPAAWAWYSATILVLYRSWTGRFPVPQQAGEVLEADPE